MRLVLPIAVAIMALPATAAMPETEAPRTRCDDLAAHPADTERVAPGIYWEVLDGLSAVTACEEAVQLYPNSKRLIFQLGRALIQMKRRDEGFPYLYEAANSGYVIAQATLGGFYQWDLEDYAEAERWYRIGAKNGSVSAMVHLGDLYASGKGVRRDYAESFRWYRQAALKGYALAENNLGWLYSEGLSVPRDYEEALRWFRRAALKGYSRAQYNVAESYELGHGVEINGEKAFEWYTRSALQGYSYAQLRLARLLEQGSLGLHRDPKEALYWYRKAQHAREDEVVARGRAGAARIRPDLAPYEIAEVDARLAIGRNLAPRETVAALQPEAETDDPPAKTVVSDTPSQQATVPAPAIKPKTQPTEVPLGKEYVVVATAELFSDSTSNAKPIGAMALGEIVLAEARVPETERVRVAQNGKVIGYLENSTVLPVGSRDAVAALSAALRDQALKTVAATQAAAAPVAKAEPEALPVDLGRYHALVIGANDYKSLPKLRSAVADAEAVASVLKELYGFEVETLIDPTRRQIVVALDKMRQRLDVDDNLLIYYAGHGILDHAAGRGFWLPVDASDETMVDWVSTATITDALRAAVAKHIMLVVDSCYSGALTRGVKIEGQKQVVLEALSKKRTRVVLTSGGLEPVSDTGGGNHSVFAKALLDALRENSGVLLGSELFSRIRRPIMLNAEQTPEYGDIRYAGHEGGDFIFARVN